MNPRVCYAFLFALLLVRHVTLAQLIDPPIIDDDIHRFWEAYDQILTTTDSLQQYEEINRRYLANATPGLQALLQARNYTPQEFIQALQKYPRFWQSIRDNTLDTKSHQARIQAGLQQLKVLYPPLRHVPIYFSIGALRTNGTAFDEKVLIGAEMAMADQNVVIDEFPAWRQAYFKEYHPNATLDLLCVHEYIHVHQNSFADNLLTKCLYEGVAEYISCLATGKPSDSPAITFGQSHESEVVQQFIQELFTVGNDYNWMWGENRNALRVRDLGYYIGYTICERYYQQSRDRQVAIRTLMELDYSDETAIAKVVDASRLLPQPVKKLKASFETKRPRVRDVSISAGKKNIRAGKTMITITFSEPLNGYNTGLDYGPAGPAAFPAVSATRTWSADRRQWTIEADLQPGKEYQIQISENFRNEAGMPLKPYLLVFSTQP